MKIGIMRHFKVNCKCNDKMNSSEFEEYNANYDVADVIRSKIDLNSEDWDKCYCSDLPRAITTAKSCYNKDINTTDLLREVKMYPVRKTSVKMPAAFWNISSRVAWKLNKKSQLETAAMTSKRAKEFLSKLDLNSDENVLIVAHGFFFLTLIKELRKLGFKGDIPKRMENATLYILEND